MTYRRFSLNASYIYAVFAGGIIGYFSWSTLPDMVILSTLMFYIYFFVSRKSILFIVVLTYYIVPSYGLFTGLINFYDLDYAISFFFWVTSSLIATLPWILFWNRDIKKKLYLFPILLIISIIPPVGLVSYINPILSSAVIYPSVGFMGIFLYIIMLYVTIILYISNFRGSIKWVVLNGLISISIWLNTQENNEMLGNKLYALNTQYVFKNNTTIDEYKRQKNLLKRIHTLKQDTILLPEHILGTFTGSSMIIWNRLPQNKTIYAGATILVEGTDKYENVLMEISQNGYRVLYKQRVPVPFEMWKPFSSDGAQASLISELSIINGKKVGVFICYEQYLTYPFIDTMLRKPDYILGISNLWWLEDRILRRIQNNTLFLWAKLFGVPYYYSVNISV